MQLTRRIVSGEASSRQAVENALQGIILLGCAAVVITFFPPKTYLSILLDTSIAPNENLQRLLFGVEWSTLLLVGWVLVTLRGDVCAIHDLFVLRPDVRNG